MAYARETRRLLFELQPLHGSDPFAAWPLVEVQGLALAVRDLLASRLGGDAQVERFVIGRSAGAADTPRRLRILPLPSIGGRHTDPAIRRVAVELPPDCPITAAEVVWALGGQSLDAVNPDTGEVTPTRLLTPASDRSMLGHYGVGERAARLWRTVTPAALPEGAGRRRIDPQRLREGAPGEAKGGAERETEERRAVDAVLQALRHAQVSTAAVKVRVQREPFAAKGARAEAFAPGGRFPKTRLWHVEVDFAEPVSGALAIGDGRFCGLGIMAPERRARRQDLFGFEVASDRPIARDDSADLLQAVRRALMGRARDTFALPLFSGHAPDGSPARSGHHRHAYLALTQDPLALWIAAPWRVDRSWPPTSDQRRDFAAVVDGLSSVRAGRLGVLALRGRDAHTGGGVCVPDAS